MLRLLCSIVLIGLAACDNSSPYTKDVEKTADAYFRITADYTVIDTGEEINFDYVMVCGGTITHSTYTAATVSYSTFPNLIVMPTKSGEAVGVLTPALCDAWGWRYVDEIGGKLREPDPFPDDFTPFTLWYPDVYALGFAFAYESDLAYVSPYSRLTFRGSTLERVDKEAWEAWQKKAEDEYEPIGGLPGPWGMSKVHSLATKEVDEEIKGRNGGVFPAVDSCASVSQLDLPEKYAEQAAALIDKQDGDFWNLNDSEIGVSLRDEIYAEREPLFNGARVGRHHNLSRALGVRRSDAGPQIRSGTSRNGSEYSRVIAIGSGRINSPDQHGNFYHDVYPVLRGDSSLSDALPGEDVFYASITLTRPEWNGFAFCNEGLAKLSDLKAYAERRAPTIPVDYDNLRKKFDDRKWENHRVYFNEEEVLRSPDRFYGRLTVIDRSGHIYPFCCKGR